MIGKGSEKRLRQSKKARLQNRLLQKPARGTLVQARKQIEAGDIPGAEESARQFESRIDRAAKKGGIHKNTATRLKSRLRKRLNSAAAVADK